MIQWEQLLELGTNIFRGFLKMDFKDIKELIIAIDNTSINEVEIEEKDLKLRISKEKRVISASINTSPALAEPVETNLVKSELKENDKPDIVNPQKPEKEDENMFIVKSPIVGTFYNSSSPDTDAYVKVGSKVKSGEVVCIVEAMKIMNEIKSEVNGEIQEILVENEDIVEYNQPLMIIRR